MSTMQWFLMTGSPTSAASSYAAQRLRCAVLLLCLALGSCATNPTGGANFVLMSEKSELELGLQEHEKLLKSSQVYHDAKLQALVDKVGKRLAAVSHRPDLNYHFTVIDSPDINAFALPGGYIYVNRGLLDYLTSEAQLAAVMGHEIGHVTARHAVRQDAARKTSSLLSSAVVLTTGISSLGDTADLFGGALISGYGRDMELEADALGAEYLSKAGYDPKAMVEVITVLKNQEDFNRKNARNAPAYHGLFASHPRNDTRLQQAVAINSAADTVPTLKVNAAGFRAATTGLLVGPSMQNMTKGPGRNRYYQNLLAYTMVLPDGWQVMATPTTMTATAPAGQAGSLTVEVRRLQMSSIPQAFVRDVLHVPEMLETEMLSQYGLEGYTGLMPANGNRLAVIFYNQRAFIFTGSASDGPAKTALLTAIKTFRPIARNEGIYANPLSISWIQADGHVTYADLATQSRLPEFPEDTLRLMNGDYPAGQPAAGRWIKVVK